MPSGISGTKPSSTKKSAIICRSNSQPNDNHGSIRKVASRGRIPRSTQLAISFRNPIKARTFAKYLKIEAESEFAGRGLVNDRYLDHKADFKGQITFFDWDVFERIREQCDLPDLDPQLFRRNVLTSGVDLNTLIGQPFSVQGVEFEGTEECRPCYWMDEAPSPPAPKPSSKATAD